MDRRGQFGWAKRVNLSERYSRDFPRLDSLSRSTQGTDKDELSRPKNSNQNRQLSTPINRTLAGDGISAINGIVTPLISASVWRVGPFQIVGGT